MLPRQQRELAEQAIRSRITGHGEEAPDQLLANPLNFRRHPGEQLEALRGSMSSLGWIKTVIVNQTTGHVIDGHARVEEALRQGLTSIPVTYVEITADEERLALAVLDPITEMATQDDATLRDLLNGLTSGDEALDALLAELGASAGLTLPLGDDEMDEVPDVPAEPKTKLGDLYRLGRHRLLCGKAEDVAAVQRLMDGSNADLVWTDPPYNVDYEGKSKARLKIENDKMTTEAFRTFLLEAFRVAISVTKPGAPIYIAHADTEGYNFRGAMLDAGWLLKQCLVWVKQSFVLGRQDYHWQHEPILYGWKPGAAHSWLSDRTQTAVLNFDRPSRSSEHPTMKPVALVEYCLRNSCVADGIVLDPFMGSGTTLIAAEHCGRRGYGIELDPGYCDVIIDRWSAMTGCEAELIDA